MAIKKSVTVQLAAIYGSQAANRKQGGLGLPMKAPYPTALILVTWESYMTPSLSKYTKITLKTGGALTLRLKNFLKQHFFYKKPLTRYNS
jgi:hypothetical protein